MSESRIVFDRVWMKFHRGEMHDSLRDLIPAMARKLVGRGAKPTELDSGDFWAVRDLSFEVLPGQVLGIIGSNGSGKSTTLRILTKILEPTRGGCHVTGRIGALIEISAGFHPDLTGRENVFLQGAIMGMRSKDIARKFDEIVEFSGISAFIDTPVKRYSSGMNARLGFSIAAHLDPDVLIIDEVLAVGDLVFQERAFGRISQLGRSGLPVVIVSHQLDRIAELCTHGILLERGVVAYRGAPHDCISAYVRPRVEQTEPAAPQALAKAPLQLRSLHFVDSDQVGSGEWFTLRVEGEIFTKLADSVEPFLMRIRSLLTGKVLFTTSSKQLEVDLPDSGPFALDVRLQANVPGGRYIIEACSYDAVVQRELAWVPSTSFQVNDTYSFGTVQFNPEMRLLSGGGALRGVGYRNGERATVQG